MVMPTTTLTLFASRLLLADGTRCKLCLALQFLDYPLLALNPCSAPGDDSSDAVADVLVVDAGKCCVLSPKDAQEAACLIQHVRTVSFSCDHHCSACLIAHTGQHVDSC
jgi:hypothetical protein